MKRKHFIQTLSIALLLSALAVKAQENPVTRWLGERTGTLEIYNAEGLRQSVAMELNIAQLSDSSWTWQIVYGEGDGRQERNYELIKVEGTGQYVIDEKNGIKLDLNLINNGFFSFFQVAESKLLISYELVNDAIHFRTHAADTRTATETGAVENVPLVTSWKTGTYQKAVLAKF